MLRQGWHKLLVHSCGDKGHGIDSIVHLLRLTCSLVMFDCIIVGRAIYAGPLMNRCARIVSVTPIGHILATSTVWQIACESCSTGRLCDDSKTEVTSSDDGLIWCAEHGWHTFKGIKQPLEIVQIKDKVLSQRTFPETLPRLQRLSSHTADALRQNELKYAVVRSLSSGRDPDSRLVHPEIGSMHPDDSLVKSLEGEISNLKEQVRNLEDNNSSLHAEVADLRKEKSILEEKMSSHVDGGRLYGIIT